jgi:DNA-binding IclR family transcriptional regulator
VVRALPIHDIQRRAPAYLNKQLQALARAGPGTHETVHLAVLDGYQVLYVEKISGRSAATGLTRVGGRLPAHCSGVGKALLAYGRPETIDAVLDAGLVARTPATITTPERLRAELERVRAEGLPSTGKRVTRGWPACQLLSSAPATSASAPSPSPDQPHG